MIVCCPLNAEEVTTSTASLSGVITPFLPIPEPTNMSSIKNHRNIGLINKKRCGKIGSRRIFFNKAGLLNYKWNVLLQFKSTAGDEELKMMCGGSLIAGN